MHNDELMTRNQLGLEFFLIFKFQGFDNSFCPYKQTYLGNSRQKKNLQNKQNQKKKIKNIPNVNHKLINFGLIFHGKN